jgi:phosphate transport system substrate-binding protein
MFNRKNISLVLAAISMLGCSKSAGTTKVVQSSPIAIDGSSTVFLISEAMAEEFQKTTSTKVTVASSGTGGGFKKLCAKEIAIAGASRPIKPSEVKACAENKVEYIELPVAYDGLAVVINPQNTWAKTMTVSELKKLWEPAAQETIKKWSDIREGFPEQDILLFGAGVDSGTYDYFTKAIVGEEHKSRGDFTSSEDDNVLVQGVAGNKFALGFFGFAYYVENKDKLKVVAIDDEIADNGTEAVLPTHKTIEDGTYQPLSRPIFIYVRKDEAERKEIQDFVHFYLGAGVKLVNEVGYVELLASSYVNATKRFDERVVGTQYAGEGSKVGSRIQK